MKSPNTPTKLQVIERFVLGATASMAVLIIVLVGISWQGIARLIDARSNWALALAIFLAVLSALALVSGPFYLWRAVKRFRRDYEKAE